MEVLEGQEKMLSTYEGLKHYNELRDEHVIDYLQEMKRFNLTKLEKLQILNQRPKSMLKLQVLIEENEECFSEEAMEHETEHRPQDATG